MSYSESELARDKAIVGVTKGSIDFMDDGFNALSRLDSGEYSGEDIRLTLESEGISPNHPNAWGALIMKGIRGGILEDTGKVTKMKVKKSHARKTTVYFKK